MTTSDPQPASWLKGQLKGMMPAGVVRLVRGQGQQEHAQRDEQGTPPVQRPADWCAHDDAEYRLRLRTAAASAPVSEGGNEHTIEFDGVRYQTFFLCGCYKSGTNWLGALLNLHPKIFCRGEFHFQVLAKAFENFTGRDWYVASRPRMKPYADESLRSLVRTMIFASTRDHPEARSIGDRTPRPLVALLPGAPHLYIYRDGRDVLVSWAYHWMRVGHENLYQPGFQGLTVESAAAMKADPERFKNNPAIGFLGNDVWVRQTCRDWAWRMKHDAEAARRLPTEGTPVYSIRYEDLRTRFDELLPSVYEFLGEDASLAEKPSEATKTLPGFSKETPGSKHRKGIVGDWQNYFDDRLRRLFKEEAGEALIELGYENDLNW